MSVETVPVADNEADAFFDSPVPEPLRKPEAVVKDSLTTEKSVADKAAVTSPRVESAPEPAKPTINPHMLELAESMGILREDAIQYGSDADLARTLKIMGRSRLAQPQAPETPKAKPVVPAEDDIPDFDPNDFDPKLVQLAKALKGKMKAYDEALANLPKQIADHSAREKVAEKGKTMMVEALTESGYSADLMANEETMTKIVGMAKALIGSAEQAGIAVDRKAIVKQVLPLVLGGKQTGRAPAPQNVTEAQEAQRKALQAERERDERGRFAPGAPTHRASKDANGSALRTALIDMGIDPKGPAPKDDNDTFL